MIDIDIIIVMPLDSKSLIPVIDKVYSKGIPDILIDRKVNSEKLQLLFLKTIIIPPKG